MSSRYAAASHEVKAIIDLANEVNGSHEPVVVPCRGIVKHLDQSIIESAIVRNPVEPPRVRLAQADANGLGSVVKKSYVRRGWTHAAWNHAGLRRAVRGGATLIADRIDEWIPPLSELCSVLSAGTARTVTANAYISFGTTPGLGLHWDDHDVLALQIHGTKEWSLFGPSRVSPLRRDSAVPVEPIGSPNDTVRLTAGSALWVPRGSWHSVVGTGGLSTHLTLGFATHAGPEFLAWLSDRLTEHEWFRQSVPSVAATRSERLDWLQGISSLVTEAMSVNDLASQYWRENPASLPTPECFSLRLLDHLDEDRIVWRQEADFELTAEGLHISIGASVLKLSRSCEAALTELAGNPNGMRVKDFMELLYQCSPQAMTDSQRDNGWALIETLVEESTVILL